MPINPDKAILVNPDKAILAAWRLVHSVEFGPRGEKRYPLGENAIGCIIYTEAGVMAVQISRRPRAPMEPDAIVDCNDYLAYFGRYWLDTERAVIHHQLQGQLFQGYYPDDLKRKYRLFDDKLSLEPLDERSH
jgi:catechol 1,2-dioxygenase